jgi:hypothetical protein
MTAVLLYRWLARAVFVLLIALEQLQDIQSMFNKYVFV